MTKLRGRRASASEQEISKRFRELRKLRHWSQPDLARELSVSRSRIDAQEAGVTLLKFDLAQKFCTALRVSIAYLASGLRPRHYYAPIVPDLFNKIAPDALLSDAYETHLQGHCEEHAKDLASLLKVEWDKEFDRFETLPDIGAIGEPYEVRCFKRFAEGLKIEAEKMPAEHRFILNKLRGHWATEIEFEKLKAAGVKNISLENDCIVVNRLVNTSSVPTEIDKLLDDIARLTETSGGKAALARELKISPVMLSRWLSKDESRKPNGEYALQLRAWADKQLKK